ncbi:MAG: hypothetical protein MJ065_00320 [Oscillospiraceae bacterium]|nr:hypothetical protein [Oscillospiraceae bacterium]
MKKHIKKAAWIAVMGYCSFMMLGMGMLRTAQQTRRTLYGGTPALAQLSRPADAKGQQKTLLLGGGEWALTLPHPKTGAMLAAAEKLPPSTGKLLLRLFILADSAADYTAECISGA